MPLEPESVSKPAQNLGSLQSCLVEGDPEQRRRERSVRRKSLFTSVLVQAGFLSALILVPLFGRPAQLMRAIVTPLPPYRHLVATEHVAQHPPTGRRHICVICPGLPPAPLTSISHQQSNDTDPPTPENGTEGFSMPPCPSCIDIGRTEGPRPPLPTEPRREKPRRVHTLSPATLTHRVEPVYPILCRQTHRSGRVELRAVIATDGTIQSLRAVSGDPLFYQSAMEAVSQWKYRPTVLNGEPVEIDTFITVIYNIDQQ